MLASGRISPTFPHSSSGVKFHFHSITAILPPSSFPLSPFLHNPASDRCLMVGLYIKTRYKQSGLTWDLSGNFQSIGKVSRAMRHLWQIALHSRVNGLAAKNRPTRDLLRSESEHSFVSTFTWEAFSVPKQSGPNHISSSIQPLTG